MDDDDSNPEPPTPVTDLLADEVADVALDDPERAAQLVAAVAPGRPTPPPSAGAPTTASPPPVQLPSFASGGAAAGGSMQEQALPAALVVVLLLQVLVRGRFRRLVLAAAGAGLVAALVRGTQDP